MIEEILYRLQQWLGEPESKLSLIIILVIFVILSLGLIVGG